VFRTGVETEQDVEGVCTRVWERGGGRLVREAESGIGVGGVAGFKAGWIERWQVEMEGAREIVGVGVGVVVSIGVRVREVKFCRLTGVLPPKHQLGGLGGCNT